MATVEGCVGPASVWSQDGLVREVDTQLKPCPLRHLVTSQESQVASTWMDSVALDSQVEPPGFLVLLCGMVLWGGEGG